MQVRDGPPAWECAIKIFAKPSTRKRTCSAALTKQVFPQLGIPREGVAAISQGGLQMLAGVAL